MTRNKLYSMLPIACFLGFIYFASTLFLKSTFNHQKDFGVCLFRNVTGFACPSCGTTRSVKLLFSGNIKSAFYMNPLGILVGSIMTIVPLWLVFDLIAKKETLYNSYLQSEKVLKIKWIAVVLIILIIANWIWNIQKQL